MELNTPRLNLTEITWDDLDFIHDLNSRPETDRFNTIGIPENVDITREVIRRPVEDQQNDKRSNYCWIVRENDTFVGEVGLNLKPERYCGGEIFYAILPEFWGRGLGTEAVIGVLDFCFDHLKLHRVAAGVAVDNLASIRLLEKVGMIREGIGRKILPIRGEWVDNFSYSLLESDPRPSI